MNDTKQREAELTKLHAEQKELIDSLAVMQEQMTRMAKRLGEVIKATNRINGRINRARA